MNSRPQISAAQPRIESLTQVEIDEKSWKYLGYRSFARFAASDTDFFVLRRFDYLNARVLLTLQDELSALEEELETLEQSLRRKDAEDIDNGTLRPDPVPRRAELIALISEKMDRYNRSVLTYSELRSHDAAPKHSVQNVKNWFTSYDDAVDPKETLFIHKTDLVPIICTSKSVIRDFFETHVFFRIHGIFRQKPPQDVELGEMEARKYINNAYIEVITAVCILVAGVLLLIMPLWILPVLGTRNSKLGLITGFIIAFLLVMWVATTARHLERLGATAAYAAVLVVFLQLGTQT